VGRGERSEASSEAECARNQHTLIIEEPPNDAPGEQLTDLARHWAYRVSGGTPGHRPKGMSRPLEAAPSGSTHGRGLFRSNSQAAKHRMWTWNLSSPGLSPSRAN